ALDLGSLRDIRRFTQHFAQSGHSLHALVCNAGVQNGTLGARTADGHEQTFGINHLGHFLLVNLLLPRLAAGGRIVTVSSAAHDPARRTGLPRPRLTDARLMAHPETDPELDTDPALAARRAYATSKLCNLLFTHELARRLATSGNAITVNAFDPGFMPGTALSRSMTPMPRFLFQHLLAPLGRLLPGITSPEQSGAGLARLVEDPALTRVNGGYFTGSGAATPSIESRNVEKAAVLWRQSAELVGLTPEAG
ncbi:MAG: SDR family NAD(P)-dependent oxidoreductase, partial [Gammaproteobacteria bacterium]|nr:SDR family NAD(P)-dependent oxidoreductase [Gammaproteobacteria bacterium]